MSASEGGVESTGSLQVNQGIVLLPLAIEVGRSPPAGGGG